MDWDLEWHNHKRVSFKKKKRGFLCPSNPPYRQLPSLLIKERVLAHESWAHQHSICITLEPWGLTLPKKLSTIWQKEMVQLMLICRFSFN